jgi:hypothetical protein
MTEGSRAARQLVLMRRTLRHIYNPLVDKWFKEPPALGNKRGELKQTCLVDEDDDNLLIIICRILVFYLIIGFFRSGLATFYGSRFDRETDASKHPQLFLYFSQDSEAVPKNETKIDKEKSIRLMKVTEAVSKGELIALGRRIEGEFVNGKVGHTYTTGKTSVSYTDEENGFFRGNYVLVNNENEGIELYRKFCRLADVTFKMENITVSDPERQNVGGTRKSVNIAGKVYKEKRYRPVANVRFRYAYLSFGGTIPPFFLVDLTCRHRVVS